MAHRKEPTTPRARAKWNIEHSKKQRETKAAKQERSKIGKTRKIRSGSKWKTQTYTAEGWKDGPLKAPVTKDHLGRDPEVGAKARKKVRENPVSEKTLAKVREETEKLKIAKEKTTTTTPSETENQNKQNAGISSKKPATPKKETNQDKISKLQKRIDRGGMMMKRGQLKYNLERQIKKLREKEKSKNKGGTGSVYSPQTLK